MNAHVGVYCKDQRILEALKESAADSHFIIRQDPPLEEFKTDHFIICDLATFLAKKDELGAIKKDYLFVISDRADEENMRIVEEHKLFHLVGQNDNIFGPEIIANLQKIFDRKYWGLKYYMDESAEVKILSLSDSKFTNEMVEESLRHFDFTEYFSSPIEYLQVMANELISNSLYKGPNKKRAEQGLDSPDRKSAVFLKGSDLVQVSLGMDSRGVALSVQDSFGGLTYELLISSLKRSFEEKTVMEKKDGAGLGLYLTFLHSNQFIINFRKDYRTEVICIIEKNKRYKNYKQRIRSFHFFQEVASEKTDNK